MDTSYQTGFNLKGVAMSMLVAKIASCDTVPGYIKMEQMKAKISCVLVALYHEGQGPETIEEMGDRVAEHLGYDSKDPVYQDAWFTSFMDASVSGLLDQDDADDYTDYSMRLGEMGK